MSPQVARPGDTLEDYVERQIAIWRGEWVDGTTADVNYRDLMYLEEDHDRIEQKLRDHLMERYGRSDPNRENNNPEVWFRNNLFDIRDLIDRAIDGNVVAADGGVISPRDTNRILEISGNIAWHMKEQDALHVEFGVPDGIRGDDTKYAQLRTLLREDIQAAVRMTVNYDDEQLPVNQMNRMREDGERRLNAEVSSLRGQRVTDARVRSAATRLAQQDRQGLGAPRTAQDRMMYD